MEEALIKRIPPHSIEAEQSVIGAMLLDRDAILRISAVWNMYESLLRQFLLLPM